MQPRVLNIVFSMLAAVLLAGCLTNYYSEYYVDQGKSASVVPLTSSAPVQLKIATTEEDVVKLMEDGYMPVGYSSFSGPYTPFSLAVDTAKAHGASLVLLDIRFRQNKQYTSVMYMPSFSSTYSSGTVGASAYRPGGFGYASGTYSGTSHTTTMNAIPVQRSVDIFDHDAMFFKKVNPADLYGVCLNVPQRLPTEKKDASIQVRVSAVLHGSKAEIDGIKRGQVIKTINGTVIKTRSDIAPFLDGCAITTMEAVDAE